MSSMEMAELPCAGKSFGLKDQNAILEMRHED